jgi:ABC-type Fe3+-hydroxamate transport system substrate-binding protein
MRIVSLCPSLTELVFDLGLGDDLVGRTKFCVHPGDGVGAVEKVGGTKNPKIDRIIELAPDIVLLNEEENRREDAEALQAAGLMCHVSFPHSALDTAEMVRSIAEAVHASVAGERIARDIETRHARVAQAAAARSPVTYAYLIWRDPLMTLNADTFVSALLGDAGGRNVFAARSDRYPTITPDELRASDPGRSFYCRRSRSVQAVTRGDAERGFRGLFAARALSYPWTADEMLLPGAARATPTPG